MTSFMDNLNRNIKHLMQKHDISNITELSKRVKMRQSTLHRVFTGEVKDPKYTTLKQLADYFGISAIELIECDLQQTQPTTVIEVDGEYYPHTFSDVPVRNDIFITENSDALSKEHIENKSALRWPSYDEDAYAVKCLGSSMTPRIKSGEFVVIEPNHAISSGDEVLVITTDNKATVKTFLFERDEEYHLLPVNEDTAPIRTPKSTVESLHYVVGIAKSDLIKK